MPPKQAEVFGPPAESYIITGVHELFGVLMFALVQECLSVATVIMTVTTDKHCCTSASVITLPALKVSVNTYVTTSVIIGSVVAVTCHVIHAFLLLLEYIR